MTSDTTIPRRRFLGYMAATVALALTRPGTRVMGWGGRFQTDEPLPPNIVFILTDDQDYQSWAEPYTIAGGGTAYAMPFLRSMPGGGWVDFTGSVCNHAICAPSRATLLTGQYAHQHGVIRNGQIAKLDATNTLPVWLQQRGYDVALFGKYSFGKKDKLTPQPPGWAVFDRGGRSQPVFASGVDYIQRMAARSEPKPFMLCLWPVDPHRPITVQPEFQDVNLIPPPMRPNLNEVDVSDKPGWVRAQKPKNIRGKERERAEMYKSVMGVDKGIRSIYETLEATGMLQNTIIIFSSDNGYQWGNHRLSWKDAPYEESIRVPLVMRLPGLAENRTESRVVSHVDIVATIVEATGATPGRTLAGSSLLPIASDPTAAWPGVAYIGSHGSTKVPEWHGVRVDGYTYVEYPATHERELYDLTADPAQLQNVAGRSEYAEMQAALAGLLAATR